MIPLEGPPEDVAAASGAKTARKSPGGPGKTRPPRRPRSAYPKLGGGLVDGEARRLCAVILEVLGGGRTPTEAASAIGVSVPRYYALEARALGGLLKACERRGKGRRKTPEAEMEKLRAEVKRLEGQCDRFQALLRASQRAVGLAPPPAQKAKGHRAPPGSKRRRRRRPQVRALRAAKSLRKDAEDNTLAVEGATGQDAHEVGS
jgi:hypothetical protein